MITFTVVCVVRHHESRHVLASDSACFQTFTFVQTTNVLNLQTQFRKITSMGHIAMGNLHWQWGIHLQVYPIRDILILPPGYFSMGHFPPYRGISSCRTFSSFSWVIPP